MLGLKLIYGSRMEDPLFEGKKVFNLKNITCTLQSQNITTPLLKNKKKQSN